MSQTNEPVEESGGFVCPNAACGRIFAKPLKATDLRGGSRKSFDACPYCLTEVTASNALSGLSAGTKEETSGQVEASKRVEVLGNSPECKKHFGYLSERSLKERIPDECMTCKDIVQCMLKKTME